MQQTINERFKIIVERWYNGNDLAFARSLGKPSSSFAQIIHGNVSPRAATLQSVCKVLPKLNPSWLLLGEGDMERSVNIVKTHSDEEFKYLNSEVRRKDELITVLKQQVEDLREFNRMLRENLQSAHQD